MVLRDCPSQTIDEQNSLGYYKQQVAGANQAHLNKHCEYCMNYEYCGAEETDLQHWDEQTANKIRSTMQSEKNAAYAAWPARQRESNHIYE